MGVDSDTQMGGADGHFPATRVSMIDGLQGNDEARRRVMRDELCRLYWKPVYRFLRIKGQRNEQAKDLTQSFFHEVVFGRDLVGKADLSKGRFRTLILTALERFAVDVHRRENAQRRRPEGGVAAMPEDEDGKLIEPAADETPELAFNRALAIDVLREALESVKKECQRDGKAKHWGVFEARVVGPILLHETPAPLEEICEELGIKSPGDASNMIVTVKRRFRTALRKRISQWLNPGDDVDVEMARFIEDLSRR